MTEPQIFPKGYIVQNSYEIIDKIGEGGMGQTYKAHNIITENLVVIKVISENFLENPQAISLFQREATLLRNLKNDAIVSYETTLRDEKGRVYLIMEYLDGQPLSYFVKRGGKLSDDNVIALAKRLALGLDAVHQKNIVHRDIAPDNIIIVNDQISQAKIIDFGLASDDAGGEHSLIAQDFAGKLNYASPEQLKILETKITGASDCYSLGLVLLKISTGKIPGENQGMNVAQYRRKDINLSEYELSPPLKAIIEPMLKFEPKNRPQQILNHINAIIEQKTSPRNEKQPKRRLFIIFSAIATLVLAIFFFNGLISDDSDSLQNQQIAENSPTLTSETPSKDERFLNIINQLNSDNVDDVETAFKNLLIIATQEEEPNAQRAKSYEILGELFDPLQPDIPANRYFPKDQNASSHYYNEMNQLSED